MSKYLLENVSGFDLKASRDELINATWINKFGVNTDIDKGTDPEDIWEFGGIYNFSKTTSLEKGENGEIINFTGVANITSISSSNVLDVQEIVIIGLDVSGYEVTQRVTLQGQTVVALPTPLWRVYRAFNDSEGDNIQGGSDTNIKGIVYIYTVDATVVDGVPDESDEIRAVIGTGNQTLMSIYTVPRGKTAYFYNAVVGLNRTKTSGGATFQYLSRRVGKNLTVKFEGSLNVGGTSAFVNKRIFPDNIPELTDILIRVLEVSEDNTGVFASFDILLEDNQI